MVATKASEIPSEQSSEAEGGGDAGAFAADAHGAKSPQHGAQEKPQLFAPAWAELAPGDGPFGDAVDEVFDVGGGPQRPEVGVGTVAECPEEQS